MVSFAAPTRPPVLVLQGERKMASDNKSLGRFELTGIPPAPRGVPQVEVTFDIDANGILSVSAKDMSSGKTQQIKITAQSGLSEEEIKKAVREAELRADEDKAKVEAAKQRNDLENLVYQTEKLIKDAGAKIPDSDKKSIETVLADAKKVVENKSASVDEMKSVFTKLQEATHKLSSEMYKQQGAAGGAQGAAGAQGGQGETADAGAKKDGDDVIDADYKDVN